MRHIYVHRFTFLILTLLVFASGGFFMHQPVQAQEEPAITIDEAIRIATEHVGGGTVEKVELERFLGVLVYEVEFVEGPEVSVHAQNGNVVRVKLASTAVNDRRGADDDDIDDVDDINNDDRDGDRDGDRDDDRDDDRDGDRDGDRDDDRDGDRDDDRDGDRDDDRDDDRDGDRDDDRDGDRDGDRNDDRDGDRDDDDGDD